jgi:phytoene synthase
MLKQIQNSDYDRYISLIFSPKDKREDLEILALFNLEMSRVKNKVSEPMLGLIRFQWWREAIDEIFDFSKTPRNHELVNLLRNLVEKYKFLSKEEFIRIIDAREKDLETEPFQTYEDFKNYLKNTSAPINILSLQIIFEKPDIENINLIENFSEAWAYGAFIRSAYRNLGAGKCIFPQDLMLKYQLKMSDFGKPEFLENSKNFIKQINGEYSDKLNYSITEFKKLEKTYRKKSKLMVVFYQLAKHNLKQIENNDFNVLSLPINYYLGFVQLMKLYLA